MISMVWLAGSDWSVLRRSDQVMVMLALGDFDVGADRELGRRPAPGDTVSVRQIAEPTKRLPCGSSGSSS